MSVCVLSCVVCLSFMFAAFVRNKLYIYIWNTATVFYEQVYRVAQKSRQVLNCNKIVLHINRKTSQCSIMLSSSLSVKEVLQCYTLV